MAGLIDPTQTGNYPVVLSDRLLKKESNEIFTGVRYNHKPDLSAESTRARLKPASGPQSNSYDLTFLGGDGRTEYAYAGARTVGDGQYVLYFDPDREAFVLDRMDSTFHMNITRTPTNSDPSSLSRKYPPLDTATGDGSSRPEKSKPKAPRAKSPPPRKKDPPARKPERKAAAQPKNVDLALPQADKSKPKPKPKPKARPAEEDDEEENEGDDLLLVEYPGGEPKSQSRDFSPAFPSVRRFDDFMDQRESEADDADDESLGDPDTEFKLPSPVNNHGQPDAGGEEEEEEEDGPEPEQMDVDQNHDQADDGGAGSPNLEDDLEKDLEEAFEAANSQNDTPADGDESEISEED